jgi:hypothetical protein
VAETVVFEKSVRHTRTTYRCSRRRARYRGAL